MLHDDICFDIEFSKDKEFRARMNKLLPLIRIYSYLCCYLEIYHFKKKYNDLYVYKKMCMFMFSTQKLVHVEI